MPAQAVAKESKFEYKARIAVLDDGSIQNRKIERYALFLSQGLGRSPAWKLAFPGAAENNTYRRRIEDDGSFKARVAFLIQEKTELEANSPWGPLLAQAKHAYRQAVAKDDLTAMMRATDMAVKLTERMNGTAPAANDAPDGAARGPGRPVTEAAVPTKNPSEIAAKLMTMGRHMAPHAKAG
jgi:hypothetical protein